MVIVGVAAVVLIILIAVLSGGSSEKRRNERADRYANDKQSLGTAQATVEALKKELEQQIGAVKLLAGFVQQIQQDSILQNIHLSLLMQMPENQKVVLDNYKMYQKMIKDFHIKTSELNNCLNKETSIFGASKGEIINEAKQHVKMLTSKLNELQNEKNL